MFLLMKLLAKRTSRTRHILWYDTSMPLKDPEARKKYNREHRLKNLEKYKQRDREYRENNAEKIYERNKKYVANNIEKQRTWVQKASRTWRKKHGAEYYKQYAQKEGEHAKHAARARVYDAIRRGIFIRPGHCVFCGIQCKPHAHHDDYEKPLEVIWLCLLCHKSADKKRSLRKDRNISRQEHKQNVSTNRTDSVQWIEAHNLQHG